MHMHILCCKSGDDREFPNRTERQNSVFFTDHNSVLTAAQFRPHLLWSFAGIGCRGRNKTGQKMVLQADAFARMLTILRLRIFALALEGETV